MAILIFLLVGQYLPSFNLNQPQKFDFKKRLGLPSSVIVFFDPAVVHASSDACDECKGGVLCMLIPNVAPVAEDLSVDTEEDNALPIKLSGADVDRDPLT
jgi:hypothetical protein